MAGRGGTAAVAADEDGATVHAGPAEDLDHLTQGCHVHAVEQRAELVDVGGGNGVDVAARFSGGCGIAVGQRP